MSRGGWAQHVPPAAYSTVAADNRAPQQPHDVESSHRMATAAARSSRTAAESSRTCGHRRSHVGGALSRCGNRRKVCCHHAFGLALAVAGEATARRQQIRNGRAPHASASSRACPGAATWPPRTIRSSIDVGIPPRALSPADSALTNRNGAQRNPVSARHPPLAARAFPSHTNLRAVSPPNGFLKLTRRSAAAANAPH